MIRLATEDDFESILDMSAKFWLQTMFDEEFEPEHTEFYVQMAFDHGLLAVCEIDGKNVGFCAAIKSFILGSTKAEYATELAWYLDPDHRKGKNGIALLRFMEGLVKEQKIKYWVMISMQSSMPEAVGRMYESEGYTRSETSYTKVFHYGGINDISSGCVLSQQAG